MVAELSDEGDVVVGQVVGQDCGEDAGSSVYEVMECLVLLLPEGKRFFRTTNPTDIFSTARLDFQTT